MLSSLRHTWMITPGVAQAPCLASENDCRAFDFVPSQPGDYFASLVVSDAEDFDRNCALIQRWNDRLGCRRNAIATVQIHVVVDMQPEIIVSGDVAEIVPGEPVSLDASLSRSFDGTVPDFTWSIDGEVVARERSVVTISTTEFLPSENISVELTATDRLGRSSEYEIFVQVASPQSASIELAAVASQSATIPFPHNFDDLSLGDGDGDGDGDGGGDGQGGSPGDGDGGS
ncbi:MAG: hypothetical protein AAF636_22315 [Pseudomonadota bacterium]